MANKKTAERFFWANNILDVQPADSILEIGCGAGLLAEQIATKLSTGKLVAIDKSEAMLDKAIKRNQCFVEKGTAHFFATSFLMSGLPRSVFNKIVAFNVNFFWKNPVRELKLAQQLLKRGGKLFIFHQAPYNITIQAAQPVINNLETSAFEILDVQLKKLTPTPAFCIIAKPVKKEEQATNL